MDNESDFSDIIRFQIKQTIRSKIQICDKLR